MDAYPSTVVPSPSVPLRRNSSSLASAAASVDQSVDHGRYPCTICNRTFGRHEHLRRHNLVHVNKQRSFKCNDCGKKFFRRDTLQRHQVTHENTEPNLLRKGARACQGCQIAKARCSGGLPCVRCQSRSLSCQVLDQSSQKSAEPHIRASPEPNEDPNPSGSKSVPATWVAATTVATGSVLSEPDKQLASATSPPSSHQPVGKDIYFAPGISPSRPAMQSRRLTNPPVPLPHWQLASPRAAQPSTFTDVIDVAPDTYPNGQSASGMENNTFSSADDNIARSGGQFRRPAENRVSQFHTAYISDSASSPILRPIMNESVHSQHRLSIHASSQTPFHPEHRSSFHADQPMSFVKSPNITSSREVIDQAPRNSVNETNGNSGNTVFGSAAAANILSLQNQPPVYDVDAWNPNALLSTINWLADTTTDFDSAIVPLPMSESVYLNNLSHLVYPLISNPFGGSPPFEGLPLEDYSHHSWSEHGQARLAAASDNASESIHSDETRAKSGGSGQFYIDNESSYLPRTKRRKTQEKPPIDSRPLRNIDYSLRAPLVGSTKLTHAYELPHRVFDRLQEACQNVTAASGASFVPFNSPDLPSKDFFDHLIFLYFKSFQPHFPMLHFPTFGLSEPHWLLVLAISAIGSHYVEMESSEIFSASLHEALRRVLILADENISWWPSDEVVRTQVKLLCSIGLLYTGDLHSHRFGFRFFQDLVTFCQERWQFDFQVDERGPLETQFKSWITAEVRNRTGYCILLLDTMCNFQFARRSNITLDLATVTLPCNEKLWAADNSSDWQRLMAQFSRPPSLLSALQDLYVEKSLSAELSEFARILLIHGIFQRSWEVGGYFRQVLSRYEPSNRKDSRRELNVGSVWLPSHPTFAKWRNSSCDCLDILHWSANSYYMGLSGIEHPTIMHLHISRIVLLTPLADIINLARFSVEASTTIPQAQMLASEQAVRKWATQDQYKARLAVAHAGMLWWHLRRFSVNAFYEPVSVALATLVLWAFPTFRKKPLAGPERDQNTVNGSNRNEDNQGDRSDSEEAGDCDIILLDRPTDDELKRDFVRRGHSMVPNLAGVGSLYGDRAPELVLQEGRKILYSLTCWGIRRQWLAVLDGLLEVTRRSQQ